MTLPLVLVAAVARNGVIGGRNRLLWRLPSDLKRFKVLTMGKPLVMGRKTFESVARPLPGRETIVVTRDHRFSAEGVRVAHGLEEGLALAVERAAAMGAGAIVVAGGGELYAETIDRADRLAITEVALEPEGDARFPPIDPCFGGRFCANRACAGRRTRRTFLLSSMSAWARMHRRKRRQRFEFQYCAPGLDVAKGAASLPISV